MKKRILQRIADSICIVCENSKSEQEFRYWFNLGINLNAYLVVYHDIYLDWKKKLAYIKNKEYICIINLI
jgi:hypothetical protein